ncbi:MAG: VOC family protein, partial [Eubacterium sp.]|nr:VOC family protein [Eubacterium sp.]
MKYTPVHYNYNVSDLEKSLKFYDEALGLKEKSRKFADDGSYIIVFIGNDTSEFEMELTWLKDHPQNIIWVNVNFTLLSEWLNLTRLIKSIT